MSLLNHAYTRRYAVPSSSSSSSTSFRATQVQKNFRAAMATLSFGEKIEKIGPADPKIIVL